MTNQAQFNAQPALERKGSVQQPFYPSKKGQYAQKQRKYTIDQQGENMNPFYASPTEMMMSQFAHILAPNAESYQPYHPQMAAPAPQNYSGRFEKQTSFKSGQSSNATNQKVDKTKYKTEMCKNWIENNFCRYGNKCQFAHGGVEMIQKNDQANTKYKSKKCQSFFSNGFCLYGNRCLFRHEDRTLKEV
jgi:hypothetical protein